jgi:hypothetical protein
MNNNANVHGQIGHIYTDTVGDVWVWADVTPLWRKVVDFLTGSWSQGCPAPPADEDTVAQPPADRHADDLD